MEAKMEERMNIYQLKDQGIPKDVQKILRYTELRKKYPDLDKKITKELKITKDFITPVEMGKIFRRLMAHENFKNKKNSEIPTENCKIAAMESELIEYDLELERKGKQLEEVKAEISERNKIDLTKTEIKWKL